MDSRGRNVLPKPLLLQRVDLLQPKLRELQCKDGYDVKIGKRPHQYKISWEKKK